MSQNTPALIAGGTIRTCRFCTLAGTSHTVEEADANEDVLGISQEGADQAPLSDYAPTEKAADSGDAVKLFGLGDVCLLTLGGTVTAGNRLKSDADGKGVAIATTGTTIQKIGAIALEDGVLDEKIRVQVHIYSERPALV